MIYKYSNHFKFMLMIFFGLVASFQNIVAAYMIQTLTNIATIKKFGNLGQFLWEIIIALIVIFVAGLIFNRLKTGCIQETNIFLRSHVFKGMLEEDEAELGFLTNDFKLLETNRFDAQIEIIMQSFSLVLALGYALLVNWLITLLFLLGSCVPMLVSSLFQKPVQNASKTWTAANSDYVNQTKNFLASKDTLALYQKEENATQKNQKKVVALEKALRKMNLLNLDTNSWVEFIAGFMTFLLPFMVGIYLVVKKQTTLGALFAIVQLSNSFVNPILVVLADRNKLSTTKEIAQKVEKLIIKSNNEQKEQKIDFDSLEVNDLTLTREKRQLASNINFTLTKGQKLAVIGQSGVGKSTLLKYLLKGKFGQAKEVILNYHDQKAGTFSDLFAYASQAPVIFADTLWFNLTLGEKISEQKVREVCQKLDLMAVVSEKGWEYQLGNNADKLSGGQLARIELARAILTERPVLLLDEINASLDKKTSDKIHKYLLKSNLTFIEVIHHYEKDELQNYDQIVELG